LDAKGKTPLNAKDGVLTFQEKGGQQVAKVKSAPKNLEIIRNVPTGYESNWVKNEPKVQKPVIEGKLLKSKTELWSVVATKTQKNEAAIRYDYKAKGFVAEESGSSGTRAKEQPVVVAHVGAAFGGGNASRSSGRTASGSY
jgi:hypothetical protein